jgi:hypothetical protein
MFGSLITQPLRIATRGVQLTLRGAHEAIELAEGVASLVAGRLMGRNGRHDGEDAEPSAWSGPAASSTSSPADRPAPVAEAPPATTEAPSPAAEPGPPPAAEPGPPPGAAPPPRAAAPPAAAAAPPPPPPPPPAPEEEPVSAEVVEESLFPGTGHISEEPELAEEVAEPGAEEGAGAQVHIAEPWDGYATMKAADIVDRLQTATREELAAVELYELSGRNRKSVVTAAQRALKQASPPR